ncbi:hypothetical protein EVC45_33565 [Paraburkholderia sp. UYCP14C]|nr:hypothetical protein EVC45_33565 [Paraburkholderia sp. UYCP14C]
MSGTLNHERVAQGVVVTGASQEIGRAIVQAFRKLDYAVVATCRSIRHPVNAMRGTSVSRRRNLRALALLLV